MAYSWLTLEQLKERAEVALEEAHNAPKSTSAWARKSQEWINIKDEIARREGD